MILTGAQEFRSIAGHLVTGASVIVTMANGEPFATTAGSVVAASWDPPLLAVLFRTGSRMAVALDQCGQFTINILAESHHNLARRFARPDRGQGWDALAGIELQRRDPAPPVMLESASWAACTVRQTIPMGDHCCFVGEVLEGDRRTDAAPLAYFRGRFHELGPTVAPAVWTSIETDDLTSVW